MRAIILSIGDELVLGQTIDTNSAWLSQQLAAVGCAVAAHLTVADDQRAIEQAIEESVGRCDFLIITGGIGPTEDDLTRQALAAVLRAPLELNETWLHVLHRFFEQRGRPMPETNRIQAMVPRGATMISNSNGTAAGIDATYVSGDQKTLCRVFVMPGVPREMQAMFTRDVLPHMKQQTGGAVILSRTLHTFGLGESTIAEKLGDLMRRDRNPSVGTTVSGGVVSLRLNARYPSAKIAVTELGRTYARCKDALGDLIYGEDDETLATVISRLWWAKQSDTHAPCPFTVATAESCTGGLLAKMLTDVPGSSRYFKQGWVTYSNESKSKLLGIEPTIIEREGAVSEAVVQAMATRTAALAKATYALAISGVAGPDGGTPAKPVGTVWIALASSGRDAPVVTARNFNFPGDREWVRDRSAKMALTMLRFRLLGKDPPF